MASSSAGRSILRMIIKNFIESLTPKKIRGDFVGTDNLGNKYYEIPANPCKGKRYPVRWYETNVSEDWEQKIPIEWEAWLRGRRTSPPVMEERELKKQSEENSKTRKLQKKSFPVYEDYEKNPGEFFEKIPRDKS